MTIRAAVVGLGNMGLGMAGTLARAGVAVRGFDLNAERTVLASALGVPTATSAEAAMREADVTVLSLPNGHAVATAVDAFLAAAPDRAVLVDTSTLDVGEARAHAARVADRGRAWLDAPVSGGPPGAASGQLTMMVGGAAEALERARPVLQHLAAHIHHVGAAGAGQVAKLANNLLLAAHMVAAAEAMRLAEAAGVAPEAVLSVINAASGRSAVTEVNLPRWVLSGTFNSGFSTGLMRKDVGLAIDLLHAAGAEAPLLKRAAETWLVRSAAVPPQADFNHVPAWLMAGGRG